MEFTVDFVTQLNQIDKTHWQRLFASANPFIQYDYLLALEQSQCVSKATGWQPFHVQVTLKPANGTTSEIPHTPVALMPMYLKNHSYGEYLFDWSWAQAHEKQGYSYYPKLVSAIPFTPVSGKRLAIAKEYHAYTSDIIGAITQSLKQIASSLSVSNVQLLFHQEDESEVLKDVNQLVEQQKREHNALIDQWHCREDVQFHWFNQAYQSFDHFLSALTARKRKVIKKERQKVAEQGITFERISGQDASRALWQQFFIFYQQTYLKRSGHLGYLTLECFLLWAEKLPEHITLVIAKQHQEQIIAASLFFHDDTTLYGRYWGASESFDFLHFEACYYQGIEIAIDNHLKCFNAGAQGEHKVARGFTPITTYGHYLFCHTPFAYSIIDYLRHEQQHHQEYRQQMTEKLPYKTTNNM